MEYFCSGRLVLVSYISCITFSLSILTAIFQVDLDTCISLTVVIYFHPNTTVITNKYRYLYNNYYCIKTRKAKWETDRNRVVRELCIRSHRHTYNYRVCSYTWSVPYTRRCLSHTRLYLHNRTVLHLLLNALMNIIKLLFSYTAVIIGLLVVS